MSDDDAPPFLTLAERKALRGDLQRHAGDAPLPQDFTDQVVVDVSCGDGGEVQLVTPAWACEFDATIRPGLERPRTPIVRRGYQHLKEHR